jgi:hypothetical protein
MNKLILQVGAVKILPLGKIVFMKNMYVFGLYELPLRSYLENKHTEIMKFYFTLEALEVVLNVF